MCTQLLEIQPRELKFKFELKKQSSCVVHLANATDQYVAFKIKTTSPKKYCVSPNVCGIIKPKSSCDFTVTMQAQESAPIEMQCMDKFLIQSTVVSFDTTAENIAPGMFVKDHPKLIEEVKLRVALTSVPSSPEKSIRLFCCRLMEFLSNKSKDPRSQLVRRCLQRPKQELEPLLIKNKTPTY